FHFTHAPDRLLERRPAFHRGLSFPLYPSALRRVSALDQPRARSRSPQRGMPFLRRRPVDFRSSRRIPHGRSAENARLRPLRRRVAVWTNPLSLLLRGGCPQASLVPEREAQ